MTSWLDPDTVTVDWNGHRSGHRLTERARQAQRFKEACGTGRREDEKLDQPVDKEQRTCGDAQCKDAQGGGLVVEHDGSPD